MCGVGDLCVSFRISIWYILVYLLRMYVCTSPPNESNCLYVYVELRLYANCIKVNWCWFICRLDFSTFIQCRVPEFPIMSQFPLLSALHVKNAIFHSWGWGKTEWSQIYAQQWTEQCNPMKQPNGKCYWLSTIGQCQLHFNRTFCNEPWKKKDSIQLCSVHNCTNQILSFGNVCCQYENCFRWLSSKIE